MLAILGRGKSIKAYADHAAKFEHIYIVNTFNDEIVKIGTEYFKGKQLTHVQGPGFDHSLDQYALFSSVRILRNNNSITPVMMQRGYMATTEWKEVLEKSKNEKNHQALLASLDDKEHNEKFIEWKKRFDMLKQPVSGRTWPTVGLFAIEYVLTVEKPDHLYLFGFDFYDAAYLTKPVRRYKNTPTISAMMKYHLEQLIREFSQTQFYIFTASKTFRPNYPNCTLR